MSLFSRLFTVTPDPQPEPAPLTAAECDQAAIEALQEFGPMIDRHIRSGSPMGVAETQGALQRLTDQGRIERSPDGRYHLKV
jgi:hypothetical protein